MSEDRKKFPRDLVFEVFLELGKHFDPQPGWLYDPNMDLQPAQRPWAQAERICAVGGFRRQKTEMKDLEILYIARYREAEMATDLFGGKGMVNITEAMIERLGLSGTLGQRQKEDGSLSSWGPMNKHAVHVASGLPIDLFATTEENYCNRLVVTTGPMQSNIRVATEARRRGFEWEVGGGGFVPLGYTWEKCPAEKRVLIKHEREVFEFVGMPFVAPEYRL